MTKVTGTTDVSSFTTDAKFRAWGSAISTALQACGLVKTSDTGQVNWSTVTKPTATGTKAGYEIYRFNDTLQSTKPVYCRLDYGSGGVTSGNSPMTWITVGTSTDGAGTITGTALPVMNSGYNNTTAPTNAATTFMVTHSAANGYLLINLSVDGTGQATAAGPGFYIIERTKDSSGASTGTGIALTIMNAGSGFNVHDYSISFDTSTIYSTQRNVFCAPVNVYQGFSSGSTTATYRHWIYANGPVPAIGRLSYYNSDIPNTTVFTATPYTGAGSHTYFAWSITSGADYVQSSTISLAYLWED